MGISEAFPPSAWSPFALALCHTAMSRTAMSHTAMSHNYVTFKCHTTMPQTAHVTEHPPQCIPKRRTPISAILINQQFNNSIELSPSSPELCRRGLAIVAGAASCGVTSNFTLPTLPTPPPPPNSEGGFQPCSWIL